MSVPANTGLGVAAAVELGEGVGSEDGVPLGEVDADPVPSWEGVAEWEGTAVRLTVRDVDGVRVELGVAVMLTSAPRSTRTVM